MAKEESKLVDEVAETAEVTTEETGIKDEFNPLAFTEDNYGELGTEDTKEDVKSEKEEEEEEEEQADGWGWDKVKEEEEDVEEDEEEDEKDDEEEEDDKDDEEVP